MVVGQFFQGGCGLRLAKCRLNATESRCDDGPSDESEPCHFVFASQAGCQPHPPIEFCMICLIGGTAHLLKLSSGAPPMRILSQRLFLTITFLVFALYTAR